MIFFLVTQMNTTCTFNRLSEVFLKLKIHHIFDDRFRRMQTFCFYSSLTPKTKFLFSVLNEVKILNVSLDLFYWEGNWTVAKPLKRPRSRRLRKFFCLQGKLGRVTLFFSGKLDYRWDWHVNFLLFSGRKMNLQKQQSKWKKQF